MKLIFPHSHSNVKPILPSQRNRLFTFSVPSDLLRFDGKLVRAYFPLIFKNPTINAFSLFQITDVFFSIIRLIFNIL